MSTQTTTRRTVEWMAPFISVLVVIAGWQLISMFGPIPTSTFPGPQQIVVAASEYPLEQLVGDIWISVFRLLTGFLLAAVTGVLLGTMSGWNRVVGPLVHSPLELLRPIPPLAWIAVAIIWLGLGEASKIFIIYMAAFFPIYVGSVRGIKSVDKTLIEAGQTLGVKGRTLIVRVLLPAASPDIATGLRVGWGLAFTALVGAEVIAAKSGLGFMVMDARAKGDIAVIVYGILIIGTLGWLSDWAFQQVLMRRWLSWHFRDHGH